MSTLTMNHSFSTVSRLPVWIKPSPEKKMSLISFALAIALHGVLLVVGGLTWVHSAEYGIEMVESGVELHLVAALPAETSQGVVAQQQPVIQKQESEMKMDVPPIVKGQEKPTPAKSVPVAQKSEHQGDGSSAEPGIHKTTLHTAGGGATEERPGYLKNPAPPYPRDAIEKAQEGLVLLLVKIDRRSTPQEVTIRQSSGVLSLDESALKTIKKWKFKPAKTGMLAVESQTLVPIRFRLEDLKKN